MVLVVRLRFPKSRFKITRLPHASGDASRIQFGIFDPCLRSAACPRNPVRSGCGQFAVTFGKISRYLERVAGRGASCDKLSIVPKF